MNVVVWMLAGAVLGWISYSYFGFNEARGVLISAVIGTGGGLVGGKLIAPLLLAAPAAPDAFSYAALIIAAGAAAGFLFAGNMIQDRWGV